MQQDPAYAEPGKAPAQPTLGNELGVLEQSVQYSLVDRTNALIRGLRLVLSHHEIASSIRVALDKQVHDYLDCSSSESVWLKRSKDLLSYPFAKYLGNDLPESPDVRFTPKGRLRDLFKNRCSPREYSRKNTHLWYSWMQCKRSCLPSSEEMININYDKHLQTLTKSDDGDEETISRIMNNPTFLKHLDSIKEQVNSTYLDKQFFEYNPSSSASYSHSRTDLGSNGALREIVWSENETRIKDISQFSELESMIFCPRALVNKRVTRNHTIEVRKPQEDNTVDWMSTLFKSRTQIKKSERLSAKIQGIVEPMKVRVISKGAALHYYVMKPLQEAMHTAMRKLPCYRLIGRPLCPTDVLDIQNSNPSKEDLEWMSVDYSAATDNLSWKYSGEILKYLIEDLPLDDQDLALQVLGPHNLEYPKGRDYVFKGVMQRGQLMGSILSFPILCLANMGLYLDVNSDFQASWTDEQRLDSVLINGDDQLYKAPHYLFQRHIEVGKKVGLDMTVGKAYYHKRYANVNSTCIDCPTNGTPYQIDYLNSGLFFGQHKVMARVVSDSYDMAEHTRSGVVTVLNRVLAGSRPGKACQLLRFWFNEHKNTKNICADTRVLTKSGEHYRNIFLPESLGGMGVIPPINWRWQTTKQDRKFAMAFAPLYGWYTTNRPLVQEPQVITTRVSVPSNVIRRIVDTSKVLHVTTKNRCSVRSDLKYPVLLPRILSGAFSIAA